MMTIAWISLGLDLELDGAHVPESRALDEEQDGHQPVVGPGLAERDGEAVDNVNDYLGDDDVTVKASVALGIPFDADDTMLLAVVDPMTYQ